jgi:PhnB protein
MSVVSPVPEGQRLFPYLIVKNAAKALAFYTRAFDARETLRLDMADGRVGHAELTFAGVGIMVADEFPEMDLLGPETRGGATTSVAIYVADVDAFAARATAAGATLERPIKDEFYGDRVAHLRDPFGHRWSLHTRREEVSPEEMRARMARGEAGA